MDMDDSQLLML